MARAAKTTAASKAAATKAVTPKVTEEEEEVSTSSNALVPWQEQMERDAAIAAGMEANTGGGTFFSLKSGVLSFNGMPLPGNQMAVVVLDFMFENTFYEGAFVADALTPPFCYAMGYDDKSLAPHEDVVALGQEQHDTCTGCPMNQFASATVGKGKACANRRRLAMIPAGDIDANGVFKPFSDAVDQLTKGSIGYMKVPPTSAIGFATVVKSLAGSMNRPPYGVYMKVRVVPDAKTQFKVVFEPIAQVPDKLMPVVINRVKEAKLSIAQPYDLTPQDAQAAAPAARGGRQSPTPKRPPVVKKGPKKF